MDRCTCPYCPSPVDCAEWQKSEEAKSLPTAPGWSLKDTWTRRNTSSGQFLAAKRGGDVTKGVKSEN